MANRTHPSIPWVGVVFLCGGGLYKTSAADKCTGADLNLVNIMRCMLVLVVLHFCQWLMTGGVGDGDLAHFFAGDIPFFFTCLYPIAISATVCIILRNVAVFGVQFHKLPESEGDLGSAAGSSKRNPAGVSNPNEKFNLWKHFSSHAKELFLHTPQYLPVFFLFVVLIGTAQTMQNKYVTSQSTNRRLRQYPHRHQPMCQERPRLTKLTTLKVPALFLAYFLVFLFSFLLYSPPPRLPGTSASTRCSARTVRTCCRVATTR